MSNQLFRKAALDKLASPERLDVLMQVTSPKGWLALIVVGGVLAAVVVWSVIGSIPRRVDAEGILIPGGRVREITASGSGFLKSFSVVKGKDIKDGELIGEIEQRVDVEAGVDGARSNWQNAVQEYQAAQAEGEAEKARYRSQIIGFEGNKQLLQNDLERVKADLDQKEELLKQGQVTKVRVDGLRSQLLDLRTRLSSMDGQITQLNSSISAVDQRVRQRRNAAEERRGDLDRTSKTAAAVTQVTSKVTGRVLQVNKRPGDPVTLGEALATVQPPSTVLEPIVYVDVRVGKRIKAGMEAQISPSTVKKEESGFMRARIQSVSEVEATGEDVQSRVANARTAQDLLGDAPKIEVIAELIQDARTPSGYSWSSKDGPPHKIDAYTRITVSVVYERQRPIDLVLPSLKKLFGTS